MSIEKDLLNIVKGAAKKDAGTQPYDTVAKVVRIEKDTAWVHIDGGVSETPVKLTINAKVGDSVQVRVSGGSAWITGNASAPPTDDTTAVVARDTATKAQETAKVAQGMAQDVVDVAEGASSRATAAITLAEGTNEHFWYDSTGAHITEVTQEEYQDDPANAGGNTLITSQGISQRHGITQVAAFTADGAIIGVSNGTQSYMTQDYHSINMVDKNGDIYFQVIDFRDKDGYVTNTFEGDGSTTTFSLTMRSANSVYTVKVNDVVIDSGVTKTKDDFTFDTAPTSGDVISAKFNPYYSGAAKALSFGDVDTSSLIGSYSVREGVNTQASGRASHAEGSQAVASGEASHAEGYSTASGVGAHAEGGAYHSSASVVQVKRCYATGDSAHAEGIDTRANGKASHAQNHRTIATGDYQTAVGQYNVEDTSDAYAVIVGNGTSGARSNAATLDWNGNLVVAGDVTNGTGQKLSDLGPSMFEVSSVTTENISLNANTAYSGTITATKAGYYPIAIVGWATNYVSGQVTARSMHTLFLSSQSVGSATITYGIRNNYSSSNNGSHTFYTLWVKEQERR